MHRSGASPWPGASEWNGACGRLEVGSRLCDSPTHVVWHLYLLEGAPPSLRRVISHAWSAGIGSGVGYTCWRMFEVGDDDCLHEMFQISQVVR